MAEATEADGAQSFLANPILVVGDAGLAVARSLAALGYDVRLAQILDGASLEVVWRSNDSGVTIELEDHEVDHGSEHAELVYVAERFDHFIRVVRVARQIGAAVLWSPFRDDDGHQRRIVEDAGLVFVAASDIVVMARRQRRQASIARLEILDALGLAHRRWREVSNVVHESADRASACRTLMAEFALTELGANHVLDLPLSRITELERAETQRERADLDALLRDP